MCTPTLPYWLDATVDYLRYSLDVAMVMVDKKNLASIYSVGIIIWYVLQRLIELQTTIFCEVGNQRHIGSF
jgi:hypothetical protein